MSNDTPRQTFGLECCRDVCQKLKRELDRLNDARDREDIEDHAINFAITAWHLTEWVWKAYKGRRLDFRGDAAEASASWGKLADFRKYIKEREPRLQACGQIANGAKHFYLDEVRWPEEAEDGTTLSATTVSAKTAGLVPEFFTEVVKLTPKIIRNGQRLNAKAEFAAILDFWSSFVHGETEENTLEITERP